MSECACNYAHTGPCESAHAIHGLTSGAPSWTTTVATADAPRPRGKRHSVKPWREEVRDMIAAETVDMLATVEYMLEEREQILARLNRLESRERPWYLRLADWFGNVQMTVKP